MHYSERSRCRAPLTTTENCNSLPCRSSHSVLRILCLSLSLSLCLSPCFYSHPVVSVNRASAERGAPYASGRGGGHGVVRRPFLRRLLILHTRQNARNGAFEASRDEVQRRAAGYDSPAIRHDLNLQFFEPPSLRAPGDTHGHAYAPRLASNSTYTHRKR